MKTPVGGRCLAFVLVLAAVTATDATWNDRFHRSHWAELQRRQASSTDVCSNSGGKCFSTGQCCQGYVCAAFDDFYGDDSYAEPGLCVREKDFQPCSSHKECPASAKCMYVGKSTTKYCVPLPQSSVAAAAAKPAGGYVSQGRSGLGSPCESDNDCNSLTLDGRSKLCCQRVQRGRMGWKRMCDRINRASLCIAARK